MSRILELTLVVEKAECQCIAENNDREKIGKDFGVGEKKCLGKRLVGGKAGEILVPRLKPRAVGCV